MFGGRESARENVGKGKGRKDRKIGKFQSVDGGLRFS